LRTKEVFRVGEMTSQSRCNRLAKLPAPRKDGGDLKDLRKTGFLSPMIQFARACRGIRENKKEKRKRKKKKRKRKVPAPFNKPVDASIGSKKGILGKERVGGVENHSPYGG